jgi:hypothetical protein
LDNVTEFNMKRFIKELLRPVDDVLFNWMVKQGFVKPFLGLLGAAVGIGSSLLGARSAKKAAGRAKSAQMGAIGAAEEQYRDPSDIFGQIYPELYGPATQDIILGAERRLMPEYQALQFERMGMLTPELLQQQRAFQEAELARVGELAPMAREAIEDPRIEMEEAQRLTEEAREGLSPLEIIKAERRAAQQGIARGRELGASQIARSALERREAEEDVQARRAELARAARMGAGRAAGAARVDPFTAILGRTPSAYQTAAQLSLGPLGAMTTSPSTALGLGQAEDYRRAQAELAYGGVESAYQQARGQIQSNMFGSIGQSLGGFIGGLGSTGGSTVSPIAQNPMTTGYGTVLAPPTGGFQLPGVSTAQGILGTYGR